MQIDRLFGIVYTLLRKNNITAKELAQQFEVSVRTIYRDIEVLSAAGIPLYTALGKGGGISLLDDFVLNRSALSKEEQEQVLLALQNFSAVGNPKAETALAKLGGLFKREEPTWLEVDYSRWGNTEEDNQLFALLRAAILQYEVVQLEYVDAWGNRTSRMAEPVRLVYKSNAWYVRAFCQDKAALRTFKLARIAHATKMGQYFAPHTEEIPPIEPQNGLAGDCPPLLLRFTPAIAHRIWEGFSAATVEKMPDGFLQVSVKMPQDDWLYGYLLSFWGEVEVLQPASVQKELARRVEKMHNKYLNS
ncbi:MAG: helix-turn-helix transcriptional regulator [Oscillospiraceae bacterium]